MLTLLRPFPPSLRDEAYRFTHENGALPAGTWALTDSNEYNKQPCATFLRASTQLQAWIVQATSPAKGRWYQWSKELQADYFVMECFTHEELIALGTILGLDLDHFRKQIELWGYTARTCVTLTRKPHKIRQFIGLATIAAEKFASKPNVFVAEFEKIPDTEFHLLLTIRPKDPERASVVGDVEMKFLRNLVDEAIKPLDAAKQVDFFYRINKLPWFGASVGYVFEKLIYAWLFFHPTPLPCTPCSSSLKSLHFVPVCEEVHVFSGMTTFKSADKYKTPFCWLLTSQAFPVADTIICTDIHIITIQPTVSSRHKANAAIEEHQEAFLKSFRDARQWCHVLVTNEEEKAEALRDQVFKDFPEDVDIYPAVLDLAELPPTPGDLARLEARRNNPDEMDTREAGLTNGYSCCACYFCVGETDGYRELIRLFTHASNGTPSLTGFAFHPSILLVSIFLKKFCGYRIGGAPIATWPRPHVSNPILYYCYKIVELLNLVPDVAPAGASADLPVPGGGMRVVELDTRSG